MTKSLKALCVLFFALILLSGCASAKHSVPVTDFSADFSAGYHGQKLCGNLTYNRQGRMNLRINSPETLEGLSVGYCDGELRLSKDGLQCTADEAYLPYPSFPAQFKDLLDEICTEEENGRLKLSDGKAKIGEWTLCFDSEGYIKSLESSDGKIVFENAEALI